MMGMAEVVESRAAECTTWTRLKLDVDRSNHHARLCMEGEDEKASGDFVAHRYPPFGAIGSHLPAPVNDYVMEKE
jgi:hypothetical protein